MKRVTTADVRYDEEVRFDEFGRMVPGHYVEFQGFSIFDPLSSPCGRFRVDPRVEYNMSVEAVHLLLTKNGLDLETWQELVYGRKAVTA